jgi:hypothetical protein
VEELLKFGADISIKSLDGQSPLNVAKDASIISILQREFVSQLQTKRGKILIGEDISGDLSDTMALNLTDQSIRVETARFSSDDTMLQLNNLQTKRWGYSQSAMSWAVEGGMIESIQQMLDLGIDANEPDVSGRNSLHTCLYLASQACDVNALLSLKKIIELLLHSGANVNSLTVSGKTPLHELFCKNKTVLKNKVNKENEIMLNRIRALIVRSLLQWGADPLKIDRQGFTSLHYCAKENMSDCMIEILKSDTNIYFQDPRGRTVLHTACIFASEEVASIIARYDSDKSIGEGIHQVKDKDGKTAKNMIPPHMNAFCLWTLWLACRTGNTLRYR